MRTDDPTQGVAVMKPKKAGGYHSWEEDEIELIEARHPLGSKARLAHALALYTGQARQDVARMGPQHIRDGVMHWTRGKTENTSGIDVFISDPFRIAGNHRRRTIRTSDFSGY